MPKCGSRSIGNPAAERQSFWNFVGAEVNRLIKMIVESTLEAERDAAAGCGWHERSTERAAYRNGYWPRTLNTVDGPVEIRSPRLRGVEVAHSCFEQYQRHTDRLVAMVAESLIRGHTTRQTQAFVEEIAKVSLSPQTVSNILARLDAEVRAFHRRSLAGHAPKFLFLDGMSCRLGRKEVRVLVAWGSDGPGRGELLGYRVARSESFASWVAFIRDLDNRGLSTRRLRMVTTDDCAGLVKAVAEQYSGVPHQLCGAHKMQNVRSAVRRPVSRPSIEADVRRIYRSRTPDEAWLRAKSFARRWRLAEPAAVKALRRNFGLTLSFMKLHKRADRRHVWTNNPVERAIRSLREGLKHQRHYGNRASLDRAVYWAARSRNLIREVQPDKTRPVMLKNKFTHNT